jgi:hypothetical protein
LVRDEHNETPRQIIMQVLQQLGKDRVRNEKELAQNRTPHKIDYFSAMLRLGERERERIEDRLSTLYGEQARAERIAEKLAMVPLAP